VPNRRKRVRTAHTDSVKSYKLDIHISFTDKTVTLAISFIFWAENILKYPEKSCGYRASFFQSEDLGSISGA
jgi:hypothetical protein